MNRFGFSALLLLLATAAHAGQFGPASPLTSPGQVSQEIGFFRSVDDWEADKLGFDDGEMTQNQAYLQAGYGIAKGWEAYFRIGGADLRLEEAFVTQQDADMRDGFLPFATLGARGLLHDGRIFDVGVFAQGSYFVDYKDREDIAETVVLPEPGITANSVKEELRLKEHWDVNAGLLLQAKLARATLYAGPVFRYGQARLESETSGTAQPGDIPFVIERDATYELESNLGGVAGISLALDKFLVLNLEGQYSSGLSFGGAVSYLRFDF